MRGVSPFFIVIRLVQEFPPDVEINTHPIMYALLALAPTCVGLPARASGLVPGHHCKGITFMDIMQSLMLLYLAT